MSIFYVGDVPFCYGELQHFGIKGQKWGIRRFQNPDGTLTEEGKKRYKYHILTLKSELGLGKNRNGKINYAEKKLAVQYGELKRHKNYFDERSNKAKSKGQLEKAKKYRDRGKEFAAEMLKYKKTAKEYSNMSEEERKKINNWVIKNEVIYETIGAAMLLGTYLVSPVAVGIFPEQNMRNFVGDYRAAHDKK